MDTRNWLPGKMVLLAPSWIRNIDWSRREVVVDVTSESIRSAPAYEEPGAVGREYEDALHRHYHKTAYWIAPEQRA